MLGMGLYFLTQIYMEECDFGWALRELKLGKKLTREGWNGKGMFIFLTEGREVDKMSNVALRTTKDFPMTDKMRGKIKAYQEVKALLLPNQGIELISRPRWW